MPTMQIDGREVEADPEMTVLEVARSQGISIPTLCYHPALRPSGSCKLCVVQASRTGRKPVTLLSCVLKAREGLVVDTQGEAVLRARGKAFQNLLQMAPQAKVLRDLAAAHGVDLGPPPDGCVRCRLCIRVCKDIVGSEALMMEKRDGQDYVIPVSGRCIGCGTCVNICPTKALRLEDREGVRTIWIREEKIGVHLLERCEACGSLYATEKFLQHVHERTSRQHADVKEPHHYCPTCAKLLSDRLKSFMRGRP